MPPRKPGIAGYFNYAIVVIGLILLVPVIIVLIFRHTTEREYDTVEIAADYYQLIEVADAYNHPHELLLSDVLKAGIEAVALVEDTPHNLENRGLCYVIHGADWIGFQTLEERKKIKALGGVEPDEWDEEGLDLRLTYGLDPISTHLVFTDNELGGKVGRSAVLRYRERATIQGLDGMTVVSITGDAKLVYELGLGFNTDLPAQLSAKGFRVIPRLRNDRFYNKNTITAIINEVFSSTHFGKGIIFDGDEVLGYPGGISEVIKALKEHNAYFGWVEFAKQGGEKSIASAVPGLTIRVHSIEDKEMEIYSVSKAVARYARSVRERGCRLIYIKPFRFPQGTDNIGKTVEYFSLVKSTILTEGMTIGPPSMFDGDEKGWNDPARTWARLLITFCILFIAIYLVAIETEYRRWMANIPLVGIIVAGIVFYGMANSTTEDFVLKVLALLAALAFPILGISILINILLNPDTKRGIGNGIIYWLVTIFLAFLGGIIIAALLAERDYMLQIKAFSGVKLSLALPILAAIVLGIRLVVPADRVRQGLVDNIRYLLDFQVQVKHVVGFLILAGAGLFLLMRSGNEPLFGVGELEAGLRTKLEALLYARPRTKEFLIGHPLLLAGILWHMRGRVALGYLGIVGGSIGLASVTNTFCHLHIPITLSLLRTFWGVLLGLIVGLVLYFIVELIIKLFGNSHRKEKVNASNET